MITIFSKFCFGPITVPKGPFGVGMGPIGPKNHKESESGLKKPKNFENKSKILKKDFSKIFKNYAPI